MNYCHIKKTIVISIIMIIILSFTIFFYFQQQTESSIKESIFEQQQENQKGKVMSLAQNIRSDLKTIMANLQGLANSKYLQNGDFISNNVTNLLKDYYLQINSTTPVDRLFVQDANGIARIDMAPSGEPSYVGRDFSFRDWTRETKNTLSSQLSDGFIGMDGKNRIALTYPIILKNTNGIKYLGLVGTVIPIRELLGYYGNIYDIESQYLGAMDSKGVQLVHPIATLIGKPFFGNYTQNVTGHNKKLNNLVSLVLAGHPSSAIYTFINGERLNTGYPIIIDNKTQYSIFLITPTSTIYSKIGEIIDKERLQMLALIMGIISSVIVLVIILNRMNKILNQEVEIRTKQLNESHKNLNLVNAKLESTNALLKNHDRMQNEFIHTAAHELRTPIQSVLGFSDILDRSIGDDKPYKNLVEIINRNAKRLKRLIDMVLDISQIENKSMVLQKERFNLQELIMEIVLEYREGIKKKNHNNINFVIDNKNISNGINFTIKADKLRITQVIMNFLDNAIEFTKEGQITVEIDENISNTDLIVSVIDNGNGIDPIILPILFSKFVKRSNKGTGFGLYVSKKIIEAHDGKIWAQNNPDGKGATFSFSLPK